jgi:hypothetical protein
LWFVVVATVIKVGPATMPAAAIYSTSNVGVNFVPVEN